MTGEIGHCSFCGVTSGPFTKVEGLFTVLICIPCLEVQQPQPDTRLGLHDSSPYPAMTRAEMRESLELLPSWVLEQKAVANRQVIAVIRRGQQAVFIALRLEAVPGRWELIELLY